jgi:hypothetical protein
MNQLGATRSPGCMACSSSAKADPLLQTIATIGPPAIFNDGVLPGEAFTFGSDLRGCVFVTLASTG